MSFSDWQGMEKKIQFRSSRLEVFCKKDVLKNFAKFIGKYLCQSFFFNKVVGLRSATLLKKRLWHRCFPVNFAKFLRTPFFAEHIWWLLLSILLSLETGLHTVCLIYVKEFAKTMHLNLLYFCPAGSN